VITKIRGITFQTETRAQALAAFFAPQVDGDTGDVIIFPESMRWQIVREVRDALLSASDWTQVTDCPLSYGQREMWRIYRQALRDLPSAYPTPESVIWPVEPN